MVSADLFVILPLMYIMNQIDWSMERNVMLVRALYAVAQVFIIGMCAFMYQGIQRRRDLKKILVKQPAQLGSPAGPDVEQTIQEYDMQQLKKYASQVLMGAAVVTFIHYKWGMFQPLFIQAVMTPMQLWKNPLFKIFVMGERGAIESRPFKEENMFSAAMSGMAATNREPEPVPEPANRREALGDAEPASADDETKETGSPSTKRNSRKIKRAE